MYFDALFKIGALALLGGLLAAIYFYVSLRKVSPQGRHPHSLGTLVLLSWRGLAPTL